MGNSTRGRGRLEVELPAGQSRSGGEAIRLGNGEADVSASRDGRTYTTRVKAGAPVTELTVGHTLPAGSAVASAKLDGRPTAFTTRDTNRGREVTVQATPGTHALAVRSG